METRTQSNPLPTCDEVLTTEAQIARRWTLVTDPVRPSALHIENYLRLAAPVRAQDALVLGATPELVDLLLEHAPAVTSAEQDMPTALAMEQLGTRPWSSVHRVTGRWETLSKELGTACCSLVVSDGGPMYFPAPEGWSGLFREVHALLRAPGVFLVRLSSVPDDAPTFGAYLSRLEAGWAHHSRDHDSMLFAREATMATLATRFGALRQDGNLDLDLVSAHFSEVHRALTNASVTEGRLAVTDAHFGPGPRAGEVSPLCAVPPPSEVCRIAEAAGFEAEVVDLPDVEPVPNWSFFLVGRKK